MATDNSKSLSADIFEISDFVHALKKDYVNIPDETLYLGIFGYMSETFSSLFQNSIVMAAEYSNESIPAKAKFEKNIIANALGLGIKDINAKPASMEVMILFKKEDIENNLYNNTFVLSREYPIYIGDYEFHFDYDIILKRNTLATSDTDIYTATYDLTDVDGGSDSYWNTVSNVNSPYLKTPAIYTAGDIPTIGVYCSISQVSLLEVENKILTNNVIENKTMTFEFEDQLCDFRVLSTINGETTILTPIYEGTYDSKIENYCYYQYLDSNTIRIKFDSSVKGYPVINTVLTVQAQTTKGEAGNFEYSENVVMSYTLDADMEHIEYPHREYSNIYMDIKPSKSTGGQDHKSIEELRKNIAKEAVSRGSITSTTDLENYFNAIDTGYSNTFFFKKEDNVLTRLYSSFIVMKNSNGNIIPTNTIDIKLPIDHDLIDDNGTVVNGDDVLYIPAMTKIIYKETNSDENIYEGFIDNGTKIAGKYFEYALPFSIMSKLSTQVCSCFLNNFDISRSVEFEGTNSSNETQFIASNLIWKRDTTSDDPEVANTYILSMDVMENDSSDTMGIGEKRNIITLDGDKLKEEKSPLPIGTNISSEVIDTLAIAKQIVKDNNTDKTKETLAKYPNIINVYDSDGAEVSTLISETLSRFDLNNTVDEARAVIEVQDIILRNSICKVKAIAVFRSKDISAYAIADEVLIKANDSSSGYVYTVNFNIKTTGNVNANNNIEMYLNWSEKNSGLDDVPHYVTDENPTPIFIGYDVETEIYFLTYKDLVKNPNGIYKVHDAFSNNEHTSQETKELNREVLCDRDKIWYDDSSSNSETRAGSKYFAISNIYKVTDGTSFMFNYSDIVNCSIIVNDDATSITIKSLPVVGYEYIDDPVNMRSFINELEKRRNYIEYALEILEDSTSIDFKFVNTYGPSKIFVICDQPTAKSSSDYLFLDNVQISLYFAVKLTSSSDTYIIDYIKSFIKEEIEKLDELSEVHIPNIAADVKKQYDEQIVYFEYLGTGKDENGSYINRTKQHISKYNDDSTKKNPDYVPEFINIALTDGDYSPDITIITV